jgi:hypothetical protein
MKGTTRGNIEGRREVDRDVKGLKKGGGNCVNARENENREQQQWDRQIKGIK